MFLRAILSTVCISLVILFSYQHILILYFFGKSKSQYKNTCQKIVSSCDILIASHNEGQCLIDAITSLCNQESDHNIHIWILLEDEKDSSYGLLQSYLYNYHTKKTPYSIEYTHLNKHTISICYTGYKSKKDKLNAIIDYVKGEYIGFLDADHIANPKRITDSLIFLQNNINCIGVQSKRGVISLSNIFQLWDSNENHILNEFYNHTIEKKQGIMFFTGTTAVFRSSIFKTYKFSDSITEDTYLSYNLLVDGYKIGYLSTMGSREYVSPDLMSYIARRRRRSQGHSDTFLSHLKKIQYAAPLSMKEKTQVILHGIFYLIPIFSVILLTAIGLYLLSQYPFYINTIIICVSLCLSIVWSFWYNNGTKNFLFDTLISTIRCIPHIGFLSVGIFYLLNSDLYFYLLSFPYSDHILGYMIIYLFLLPLLSFRYIWIHQGVLSWYQRILLTITYPFIIFFGLYSVFMGFADFIFSKTYWKPIQRESKSNRIISFLYIYRKIISILSCIIISLFSSLYVFYNAPCATDSIVSHIKSLITNNQLSRDDAITIQDSKDAQRLLVNYSGSLYYSTSTTKPTIIITDEGENTITPHNINIIENKSHISYNVQEYIDMGFLTKKRTITIGSCKREYTFPSSYLSLQSGHIMLNHEPFLMKGIIPSFAQGGVNLSLEQGYKQLNEIGANLVRFYHKPTVESLQTINNLGLLFLPQPNQSTRDNAKIYRKYEFFALIERIGQLLDDMQNSSFLLGINIGNEIEFIEGNNIINHIISLISTVKEKYKSKYLITYSSYKIFLEYPVDFFSINMLDSGSTYWHDIILLLQSTKKAFIASELGGFVAFYESTSETLRAYRLLYQRNTLLSHGSDGGIIFQSHDNWAQPLFDSINNPLEAEQPDDNRGIWDKYNNPKASYYVVKDIFSDIELDLITPAKDLFISEYISFSLYNRRAYSLHNISLQINKNYTQKINNLAPGQSEIVTIPANLLDGKDINSIISYTTHNGLSGQQSIALPNRQNPVPFVLGAGWLPSTIAHSGGTIIGSHIRFFLPNQRGVICEDKIFTGYYEVNNYSPLLTGKSLFSTDGQQRLPLSSRDESYNLNSIIIKSTFNSRLESGDILLFDGVGTNEIKISNRLDNLVQTNPIQVHNYRENILSIDNYITDNSNPDIYIYIGQRNQSKFIIDGIRDITISIKNPVIFRPKVCRFIQF